MAEPDDYKLNGGDDANVKNEFGFSVNEPPNLTNQPWKSVWYNWVNGKGRALLARIKELENEVNRLKAEQGNATEANLLGQALIKLLATFGYKKG